MLLALATGLGAVGCMTKLGYTTDDEAGNLRRIDLTWTIAQKVMETEGAMVREWQEGGSGHLQTGQAVRDSQPSTETVQAIATALVEGIKASAAIP